MLCIGGLSGDEVTETLLIQRLVTLKLEDCLRDFCPSSQQNSIDFWLKAF